MTPINRPAIRVSGPADLLALVPYLIGFQIPVPSLVILALAGNQVLLAARMDLPTTTSDLPHLDAALDQLVTALHGNATHTILAGYGTAPQVNPAVQAATTTLRAVHLPVREALRVDDDHFYNLMCADAGCCPTSGTPFDPASSIAAAAATLAGLVALPDRDALVAALQPVTGAAREAMQEATIHAAQSLITKFETAAGGDDEPDTTPRSPLGRDLLHTGRHHLDQAHQHYRNGRPLDDQKAALLSLLLELPSVREIAARRTTGAPWQIQMWTDLLRRAQPDLSATPAVLLALAALQAGNGPLADLALSRALSVDPNDRLAGLLAQAVALGIDPDTVTSLLAH